MSSFSGSLLGRENDYIIQSALRPNNRSGVPGHLNQGSRDGGCRYRALPREFYSRFTPVVARDLLGRNLVRRLGGLSLEGRIVEAEAYRGSDDPASHAYRGKTSRNLVMFGKPGVAYVYFTYGMHYCLNVVTEEEGVPGAVLIRALEPLTGIEEMKKRRRTSDLGALTNGPARLTQAFAITRSLNGADMTLAGELFVSTAPPNPIDQIVSGTRIGVRQGGEKPWRFYIRGNPYVSRR